MHCPFCRHEDTKVSDSRAADDGATIRRRRLCPACERKFTTVEQIQLTVLKRSGVAEPFSREKVVRGVRKACQGRPVTDAELAALGQEVEEALRASGAAEVPADEIGVAILGPLARLDEVAYLRFASVYRNYQSVEDFAAEIEQLRQHQTSSPDGPARGESGGAGDGSPSVATTRPSTGRKAPLTQEPLIG